jgi:PAS domain S-box-containing protein
MQGGQVFILTNPHGQMTRPFAHPAEKGGPMPESIVELKKLLQQKTKELETCKERLSILTGQEEDPEISRLSEERFHPIFRFSSACMSLTFPDGRFIEVNPAFCRFLGYTADELMLLSSEEITHPDDREQVRQLRDEARKRRATSYSIDKRYLRRDGATIWGQVSSNWFYDDDGKPLYALAVIQDITDRKRIEKALRESEANLASHALELEAANRELEAFNYTVSHDLRSPLTSIGGFCEVLMGLGKGHLDEQCKSIIRHIGGTVRYMDQLIETLMNFSRLSQCKMTRAKVDLSTLAKAVAAQLKMRDPHRQVNFVIHGRVEVEGDSKLLREVLDNLLDNAWKYTGKQESALIEFGVGETNGKATYFVRDNGPGFDMTQADRLFIPFHRLHSREEFAGHGIGLSSAQRIIQRHGGRIWAEGERGKGATFYFTLGFPQELPASIHGAGKEESTANSPADSAAM